MLISRVPLDDGEVGAVLDDPLDLGPVFATHEVALAVPNAVFVFGLSLAIVYALVNTRLRRVLT